MFISLINVPEFWKISISSAGLQWTFSDTDESLDFTHTSTVDSKRSFGHIWTLFQHLFPYLYIYIYNIYIYNIHVYIYIYVDIHRIIYIHNCIHTQLYTHANHILVLVFSFLKLSSHVIPKDGMIIPKLARTLARTQVPTAVSERLELRGVAWAGGLTNDCSNVIYN
jgi:hypothetical protein